jgi:PKD repeat protein
MNMLGKVQLFATVVVLACASNVLAGQAHFSYRGVAYISFQASEYQDPQSGQSLDDLASTGANWASLLATWYMDTPNSTAIAADALKSPTDAAVIQAITDMHARGLKVMLKPHVDVKDGTFRGAIAPSDTAAWFASYTTFINHYAAIAQAQSVELFCIGCELKTMSGAGNLSSWQTIIAGIRGVYSGPLTYASLSVFPNDEYVAVSFWPLLDIAGLDVYTPLTGKFDPTVAELIAAWNSNYNMPLALRTWQAGLGMPAMFTEMGYESVAGTNITPYYVNLASGTADQQEQANCYEAALEVWTQEPWLKGIFWWGWAVPLPPAGDKDYSARGKLAQGVLKTWYSNTPPLISSPPEATPNPAAAGDVVTFSVAAGDSDGDFLTYSWDFGDATTGAGVPVTHTYATAGTYTATVTITDDFSNAVSATVSVVVGSPPPNGPKKHNIVQPPFKISRLSIKLDFTKAQNDSLTCNGTLRTASLPSAGSTAIFNAAGIIRVFQFGPKGTATLAGDTLKLGQPHSGRASFSIKLSKETLAAQLALVGVKADVDARNRTATAPFILYVNGTTYESNETLIYSAKKDTSVSAKAR